jgi:oligopeptide transport system permease protein
LIGVALGTLAGYYGGWLDAIVSRITDIFFAIPLLLGGILFMSVKPNNQDTPYLVVVGKVVIVLAIFGWPGIARLMRSSVMQVKPNDYVQAARALGATPWRIIRAHVLPNAMAPVIVVSTINLGVFIAVEATLSFLGIGLTPPAISWGVAISDALVGLRTTPHMLLFPSLFLSLAVLAFIMLGDAVRDAFDPKSR